MLDGRRGETTGVVVTDRRIVQVEFGQGRRSGREISRVDSTSFAGDHVTGATVTDAREERVDTGNVIVGVVLAVRGAGLGAVVGGQGELAGLAGVGVAPAGVVVGGAAVRRELQTDPGRVDVSLRNDDGETVATLTLAGDEASVARAISEAVGATHPA